MGESRAQEHDARARVRMGGPARERASGSCGEREAERMGPRARARRRERGGESVGARVRVVCICVFHAEGVVRIWQWLC